MLMAPYKIVYCADVATEIVCDSELSRFAGIDSGQISLRNLGGRLFYKIRQLLSNIFIGYSTNAGLGLADCSPATTLNTPIIHSWLFYIALTTKKQRTNKDHQDKKYPFVQDRQQHTPVS